MNAPAPTHPPQLRQVTL